MRSRFSKPGMTLVEVLVVLALGAILLISVQLLVVRAYRNSKLLESRLASSDRFDTARRQFENDLRSLAPGASVQLDERGLSIVTMSSLRSDVLAARHAVEVRYSSIARGSPKGWKRAEWELGESEKTATAIQLPAVDAVAYAIHDGQDWRSQWPLSVPRQLRSVRMIISNDGREHSVIIPLQPLRWRSHRD